MVYLEKIGTRRHWILAGLLALLAVVPYLINLRDAFISDDWVAYQMLAEQPAIHVISGENRAGGILYRPVTHLLLQVQTSFFSLNPLGYHLLNLIAGWLSAVLLFILISVIFERTTAIVAILAFSLAPSHAENLAWISGNAGVWATVFILLGLLAYVIWRQEQKIWLFISAMASFLSALFSCETAIVLPLLVLFVDRHLPEKPTWKSSGLVFAGSAAATGLWLVLRMLIPGDFPSGFAIGRIGVFVFRDLVRYGQLFFLPVELEEAIPWVMTHKLAVFGSIGLLFICFTYYSKILFTKPAVRLGLVGGLIALMPVAHLYPQGLHMYLAGAWFSLAIGGVFSYLWNSRKRKGRMITTLLMALWLITCGFFAVRQAMNWHEAAGIADTVVKDIAAADYAVDQKNYVFVLPAPDTLRGAFIMRNGLHQSLRVLRPDREIVVHTLLLAGMKSAQAINLYVTKSTGGSFVVEHDGNSAYDYLLPPDADRDMHPGDTRLIGPAGYRVLAEARPFNLTSIEVAIDANMLAKPGAMVYVYRNGHLQPFSKKGDLP